MRTKVGNKLLYLRDERKMSQADFAALIDLPLSTYSRLERNETSLEMEKLITIAEKLQVPVQDFLPETMIIKNTNSEKSQGGVFFGNQTNTHNHFYGDSGEAQMQKDHEIALLRKEVELLREKLLRSEGK
jgi:transcriptional regulator with XRE-family HTH domain